MLADSRLANLELVFVTSLPLDYNHSCRQCLHFIPLQRQTSPNTEHLSVIVTTITILQTQVDQLP